MILIGELSKMKLHYHMHGDSIVKYLDDPRLFHHYSRYDLEE